MIEGFLRRLTPSSLFGLFMLGSFCSCVILSGLIVGYQSRQAIIEQQSRLGEREVKVTAGFIEQVLSEKVEHLETLSRSPYVVGGVLHSGINHKDIDDYLVDLRQRYGEARFFLVDIALDIVYSNVDLSYSLDLVQSDHDNLERILRGDLKKSVKLVQQDDDASVLIAVPVYYGQAVEGILMSELSLESKDILPSTGAGDRRLVLSDGSVSIRGTQEAADGLWAWQEQPLRYGDLTLSYGFDTRGLRIQQFEVLKTTLLWLFFAFIVSFAAVYILGRRVLLNPYQELDRSRKALTEKAEQLQESEQSARQLAMVAENANDSIIITDVQGITLWVNAAFSEMTGYRPDEILGRKPGHLLQGPDTDQSVVASVSQALAGGNRIHVVILNYTKARESFWLEMDIVPVRDANDEVRKFIAIERDITERLEFEQKQEKALQDAEAATRSKSQFLAMMSHEIRTPMNGVLGTLGLLDEMPMPDEQRQLVRVARESGEFLLTILNDILDFSKLEAGKLQLESIAFDLRHLIRGTIRICEPQAKAKDLSVEVDVAANAPAFLVGDPGRIRQMLLNFMSNAVKFTEQGRVVLRVEARPGTEGHTGMCFSVQDSGIGIPKDKLDRLFQNFSQVDSSTARRFGGTGLGLAITKLLAQQMKGRVWCESTVGAGSTFYFAAPFKTAEEAERHPALGSTEQNSELERPDLKVLVAEDNRTNQMIAQSMLRRLGCRVDVAGNGQEAIEAVAARPYDIVLMDVQMPEVDGLEATRRIRAREDAVSAIPIIALTANAMAGDRTICLEAGMDDFVSKPINKQTLIQAINRMLRKSSKAGPIEAEVADRHDDTQSASDPTPEQDDAPLIDETVLESLLEDVSPDMKSEFLNAVIGDLENRLAQAQEAHREGDMSALAAACHSLVGCSASAGLIRLRDLAKQLEMACRSADQHAIADRFAKLPETVTASVDICRSSLDEGAVACAGDAPQYDAPAITDPPTSTGQDGTPLIDETVLRTMLADLGSDGQSEFLTAVIGDLESRLAQAEEAHGEGDLSALAAACHSLVGCSASVGLVRLRDLAKSLEMACKADDRDDLVESFAALPGTVRASIDICRSSLDEGAVIGTGDVPERGDRLESPEPESCPLFDETVFARLFHQTSTEMRAEFLNALIGDLESRMEQASDAFERGDMKTFEVACHSLVGCSASVGLLRLYDQAKELEKASRSDDQDALAARLAAMASTVSASADICRTLADNDGSGDEPAAKQPAMVI